MIKFYNFDSKNLANIASELPDHPVDNACLVQSPSGRLFQTEGTGLSLVVGKIAEEATLVFISEGSVCKFIDVGSATVVNLTEGSIMLCSREHPRDYMHIIYVDGTTTRLSIEEFDYANNINHGMYGGINLPIFSIKMQFIDGMYEIDNTQASYVIDIK